jgi:hypothetical protein
MSKKEKLLRRCLSMPNDFSWQELIKLLSGFGYQLSGGGKTGGGAGEVYSRNTSTHNSSQAASIHCHETLSD